MKAILFYASPNPKGSSAQIVEKLKEKLRFSFVPRMITSNDPVADLGDFDLIIFLTATYGDQELQDDMEKFVLSIRNIGGKKYAICEIGNYYGYDDYTFGSGQIIEQVIEGLGGRKAAPINSIDSLPKLDWAGVERWVNTLNEKFGRHE